MSLRTHGDTIACPGTLDFAVNVWPERPPMLEAAFEQALSQSRAYPNESPAREAIAARHGRSVDEVLLLNGACEAFWLLAHAFRPKLAACIHPSFTEPEAALRAAGAEVVQVPRDPERWSFDPTDVPEDAEQVVLGNPNNPTGSLDRPDQIASLARQRRLLVVDESFMDFVVDEGGTLARRSELPGLVVVRSLTKLWSLPGIRAGYLLAPPEVVEVLAASRQPWSVNALACAALVACAGDAVTPRRVSVRVAEARAELLEGLRCLPQIRAWPSETNFILLQARDGRNLCDDLRRRGFAVRPAASFPGLDEDYLRVAVRPRKDNLALLGALTALCS